MRYPDFEEFIVALNDREVRYLIVGAHAVAFHARPRATKDLDVYLAPTRQNARRVLKALEDFFGAKMSYSVDDLIDPEVMIQPGVAPVRIALMPSIDGVEKFADAWKRKVDAPFGKIPAHYMALDDLIEAKKAAGRPQDKADLVVLRRVRTRARKK